MESATIRTPTSTGLNGIRDAFCFKTNRVSYIYILPFSCVGVYLILVDMSWDMYTKRKLIIPTLVYNMSISDRLARIVALYYIRHASISLNLYSLFICSNKHEYSCTFKAYSQI